MQKIIQKTFIILIGSTSKSIRRDLRQSFQITFGNHVPTFKKKSTSFTKHLSSSLKQCSQKFKYQLTSVEGVLFFVRNPFLQIAFLSTAKCHFEKKPPNKFFNFQNDLKTLTLFHCTK